MTSSKLGENFVILTVCELRNAKSFAAVKKAVTLAGKKAGQTVKFGGLFGEGTVVDVSKWKPSKFLSRGGQISCTVKSTKN